LKKKIDLLQDTLKVPSVTRETLSRLVFERLVKCVLIQAKGGGGGSKVRADSSSSWESRDMLVWQASQ